MILACDVTDGVRSVVREEREWGRINKSLSKRINRKVAHSKVVFLQKTEKIIIRKLDIK